MLNQNLMDTIAIIKCKTSTIISEAELAIKLARSVPLRVKLGVDPTAPNLHLGHAVVLMKMKDFQDLGHEIIFLIGDFTAYIGDPTGKSKTRPSLSREHIEYNTQTYLEQVGKILDIDRVTIKRNSEWLGRLSARDIVELCSKVTVARLTSREDFAQRIAEEKPIGLHELLYPLFQAYDSVELRADIELGGTDQTFNLLMGRHLQESYGQEAQTTITMPLLEGLDGSIKMSKSIGNDIGLIESANEAYGKLMSISDTLMWRYFLLLLDYDQLHIETLQAAISDQSIHPMELKKKMAKEIVAKFWSPSEALDAQQKFEALFQRKEYSQGQEISIKNSVENPAWIVHLLIELNAVKSSSEAKRLIEAGAVMIDGVRIENFKQHIAYTTGMIIKVGKHRIYKLL